MAKTKKEEAVNEEIKKDAIDTEAYIAKLNQDLDEQKKKADEYVDSLKRNMAEFDNFKKRISKEMQSDTTKKYCGN